MEQPTTGEAVGSARGQVATALRTAVSFAAVAVVYFVLAKLGLTLASVNPSATPVWPPTGLAIAGVLLAGYPMAPAVFAGAFFANVTTAGTVATSLAVAGGNTLECLVGAYLIRRWSGGRQTFATPAAIAKFTLIVVFLATPVSATIGVGSLTAAGFAEWAHFRGIWTTWWLGDVAGALLFTPFVVLWANRMGVRSPADARLESAAVFLTAAALALLAFSPLLPDGPYRSATGFLAVLPLLWSALRCGQREAATVAVILSAFAVWGAHMGAGPFSRADVNESYLLLLSFMIGISLPSLALSAAIDVRRRTEEDLRLSEARFRGVAETAPAMIWTAAPDGTITFHNRQWLEYTGIPPEANERDWPVLVLHPDDRERCIAAWSKALATGEPYEIEVRNRRHDGEYRWFLTRAKPVRDENGRIVEWFGSTTDIQQLKEAGNRQTLLLAELSHRVRNTLAVVQTIAQRTITADRDAAASSRVLSARLGALAHAQDLLIAASWEGARLTDLLAAETGSFAEQIAYRGPDVILKPRAVQTFALVIHELATNSCKHGALLVPAGRVSVDWRVEGEAMAREFRFAWTEQGGPPVLPPERSGFGMALIQRAVGLEYRRQPRIDFSPAGFCFEIAIPAADVMQSHASAA